MGDTKNIPKQETIAPEQAERPSGNERKPGLMAPNVFLRELKTSDKPEELVNAFIDGLEAGMVDSKEKVNALMATLSGAVDPSQAEAPLKFVMAMDTSELTSYV